VLQCVATCCSVLQPHSYVRYLIHMCAMPLSEQASRHVTRHRCTVYYFIYLICLIHMCDLPYVCNASFSAGKSACDTSSLPFTTAELLNQCRHAWMNWGFRSCSSRRHQVATAKHCNTLQYTATLCSTLQRTAAHCNTLQHTATHSCG